MSEGAITILCALLGSGAATAAVTAFLNDRAAKKRLDTGEVQGMRWLLQDRLEQLALRHLRLGRIDYEELCNWNRGHRIYHELLGGNGDLDNLKEALKRLLYTNEKEKES